MFPDLFGGVSLFAGEIMREEDFLQSLSVLKNRV